MRAFVIPVLLVLALTGAGAACAAGRVTVAVAANFLATAQGLADGFTASTGNQVVLVHGSTGALYAQIRAGAPFDVFLAADAERPERLVAEGLARPEDRRLYALGRLTLVTGPRAPDGDWRAVLADTDLRLALANPRTAPYGVAAREVLTALRGAANWDRGVVYGDSVGQTFAFVATGNALAGLVALAQALQPGHELASAPIPDDLYTPIRQEAVLLAAAAGNPAARGFFDYLFSDAGRAMIAGAGYGTGAVPDDGVGQ